LGLEALIELWLVGELRGCIDQQEERLDWGWSLEWLLEGIQIDVQQGWKKVEEGHLSNFHCSALDQGKKKMAREVCLERENWRVQQNGLKQR